MNASDPLNPRVRRRERALARLMARTDHRFSEHALQRAQQLGFALEEVLECLQDPEQTYAIAEGGGSRRIHQRRDCALVVDQRDHVVVTVLLRTQQAWTHSRSARVDGKAQAC